MTSHPETETTAPGDPSSLLSDIRADIDATVYVYDLDGAGKNSNPISAAMSRHARSLLAAVEAALALVTEWKQIPFAVRASDECADELRAAITTALAGQEASDGT